MLQVSDGEYDPLPCHTKYSLSQFRTERSDARCDGFHQKKRSTTNIETIMVLPTSILSNVRHISEYETPIERQLVQI